MAVLRLFVHGGCQGSSTWHEMASRLAEQGWLALASLSYACAKSVAALGMLAPVVPAGFGAEPVDLPVDPVMMEATWTIDEWLASTVG